LIGFANVTIIKIKHKPPTKFSESQDFFYASTGIEQTLQAIKKLKRSILEHSLEDKIIWEWLQTFDITSLSSIRYQGWAPNRTYYYF
jgi:hypothetical protein